MRTTALGLLATMLAISPASAAAPPAIRSVVNYISGDGRFSPGGLARLQYALPESLDLQATTVQVGGRAAALRDEEDGEHLSVLLPLDLPVGPSALVLTTRAGNSAPFPITVEAYAPAIYPPTRSLVDPYGPLGCNLAASPGETLSLFAVGLGATDAAGNTVKPTLMVSGRSVEVLESKSFSFGMYRIRFMVPPGDGLHIVNLNIGAQTSNAARFPAGTAMMNLQTPSFQAGAGAPGSAMTAYQCNGPAFLALGTQILGDPRELPLSLGGITIHVKDAAGVDRPAPLYGAVWNQVNYVVPPGTAPGVATVTAMSGDRVIAAGDVEVGSVAPSLFGFNFVQVVRLRNGVQTLEQGWSIDMGPDTDQVYLVMYGSGIRGRSSLAAVAASIGEVAVPVEYAGPQNELPALDQVNMKLPRSLAGRGQVNLQLTVDGKRTEALLFFP